MYILVWPFFVWGILILLSYAIGIASLKGLNDDLINVKLVERSLGQASRVTFYANELALGASNNSASVAALQSTLMAEAGWLHTVYSTSLYGGPTLNDSLADGSVDVDAGSLFDSQVGV